MARVTAKPQILRSRSGFAGRRDHQWAVKWREEGDGPSWRWKGFPTSEEADQFRDELDERYEPLVPRRP